MKPWLITLHRWLGLPLGLVFIVTFGTGFLTAIDEITQRADYAHYVYRDSSLSERAWALTQITATHKDISNLILPTPRTPYYQVVTRSERYTYAIPTNTSEPIRPDHRELRSKDGFFNTVLQLHRNLLLGKEGLWGIEGKHYVAWTGLLALVLSLLGLWLWWPTRKKFRLKNMVPLGTKRKYFYYSHMTSGVVLLVAVLLLSITGASISYKNITRSLLGVAQEPIVVQTPVALKPNWFTWLTAAHNAVGDGQLASIRFPRKAPRQSIEPQPKGASPRRPNNASVTTELRFTTPDDWLGLANTRVAINLKESTLHQVTRFGDLSLGEKLYAILVPLHTGRNLPVAYVVVLMLFSLLGTSMVFSGVVSFLQKTWRSPFRKKARSLSALNPIKGEG